VVQTDVSGVAIGPFFDSQAVQEDNLALEDWTDRQSLYVSLNHFTPRNKPEDERIKNSFAN
jgi:hypothetical protein